MDIVSYRGPQSPGGVSSFLQNLFYDPRLDIDGWWFLASNRFRHVSRCSQSSFSLSACQAELIERYCHYCNAFLWPLFHGFEHLVEYDVCSRQSYRKVCRLMAEAVLQSQLNQSVFVNDYQLALLPRLLAGGGLRQSSFFWHIPWPQEIPAAFVEPVSELALGMSCASRIGFQTDEYAQNFLSFFARQFPSLTANVESSIAIAPVAVDHELWATLSQDEVRRERVLKKLEIKETDKVILSVERADYTKGVLERLEAIAVFLQSQDRSNVSGLRFVQVVPRTRAGLPAYDLYWQMCHQRVREINDAYRLPGWEPIVFVEEHQAAADLACLYARADIMLITAIADGLNLTAKEYVACHQERSGALILSRGCGVASELQEPAFMIDPLSPHVVAESIAATLKCSEDDLRRRMTRARAIVAANVARRWLSRVRPPSASGRSLAEIS